MSGAKSFGGAAPAHANATRKPPATSHNAGPRGEFPVLVRKWKRPVGPSAEFVITYESMSRTPIRDRPLRRPLVRDSRHPFVIPAPHSSFPRRRESTHQYRAAKRQSKNRQQSPQGQCSAAEGYARRGAYPPLGSGWGVAESVVPSTNPALYTLGCPPLPAWGIVTKTCAGLRSGMTLPALDRDFETHQSPQSSFPRRRESTHQSRAAKRQSKNRQQSPQGQCSAAEGYATRVEDYARRGAWPPLGYGWGVAESAVPTTNPAFHTLGCRPLPAWGIVTKTCAGLRSGMTLPALDRDFETHQSPQSSFPRRRESTHQYRAARLQSRNRRQSPQGQCSAWACPPLQAVRQPTLVPSHRKGDPPTAAPNLIHLCAGASRDERLQFLSNH